ncbi:MAG: hypothetical protein PHZ26_04480 [Candidatus Gracilibacteria bacterium]|nr:hypothetical protein [Candidatus Gracilibacteria bacterium]MDD2908985.1 hypothetical protein [Candidatus Gracilibacteria bacterium]
MPQLTKRQIDEFKFIYKKCTGKDLDNQEAIQFAIKLVCAFKPILLPMIGHQGYLTSSDLDLPENNYYIK